MRTTESPSNYDKLESLSVKKLLSNINKEDKRVAKAVNDSIPQIETFVIAANEQMLNGGRLFYIGAGTSGRLGILDASEIPPTYGMPAGVVIGIIAGGDKAIRTSVEHAEDDSRQAWFDHEKFEISEKDVLVGIAASGTTPYVIGGIETARKNGLVTGCITCNENSKLAEVAEYPIEVVVGPEFVTGSTRMKAGTAQKLVLNMISTSLMIKLGRVKGNKMVDMQLSNAKLVDRGTRMIMDELNIERDAAEAKLKEFGSVREAIKNGK